MDETHETEYTRGQLEAELGEAGLSITECQTRFGEYWLSAMPVAQVETTIRVPLDSQPRA